MNPLTAQATEEEVKEISTLYYTVEALKALLNEGNRLEDTFVRYTEAYKFYTQAWDKLLIKYFNFRKEYPAKYACDFETGGLTLTRLQ